MKLNSINKRTIQVVSIITLGLVLSWLFSSPDEIRESRLSLELPAQFQSWVGQKGEITGKEMTTLAKDTDYARMNYTDENEARLPHITASIVLSGRDLNNSIHRPERCLEAQGWRFLNERFLNVEIQINEKTVKIPMKEIFCEKPAYRENEKGKFEPILTTDGKHLKVRMVQYYTFFGHKKILAGHYERTIEDSFWGRVWGGYAQRWAYATFSTNVTQAFVDQKYWDEKEVALDVDQSRERLARFIKEFLPLVLDQ